MEKNNKPYGIECSWDSEYLCKKCGGLLYYDMETEEDHCFNSQCPDYPKGIEIYGKGEADLTLLNSQFVTIERRLGQIVSTCDYKFLVQFLLERRRRIVQKFFTSGSIHIDSFLMSNEILLFVHKYKSLGIRNDPITFKAILYLFKDYFHLQELTEDLKEGRYLIARKPINNKMFRLKYYDVIVDEIWANYGQVNIQSIPDVNEFRYHEVIQKNIETKHEEISKDLAQYFDRLWPFIVSAQFLIKRNYSSSLKYQYPVTSTDLANILSIIGSLKDDNLNEVSLINLLKHFIEQPCRDKNITEFISMLSGNNNKIPIGFKTNGSIILDRRTLLLFVILMHSQYLSSNSNIDGQQRIALHKQQAGDDYEKYIKEKIERIGYSCLPTSTSISNLDYDVVAVSESKLQILLIETKFRDPSPSSLSANKLIEQEFVYEKDGLLPQVIKHQQRYDSLFEKPDLFQKTLGLKKNIQDYTVKAYFITKYTPLISCYGDVQVISEKEFFEKELPKNI